MMAPITAPQTTLTAAYGCERIGDVIKRCRALKASVYLQFPRDIQALAADAPASPLELGEPQSDRAELERFVNRALQMQRSAERNAILFDYPVARLGQTERVQTLSDLTGIPFATTRAGRSGQVDQARSGYLGFYRAPPLSSPAAMQRLGKP
jgi:TPP-dependent 2-oxoacid decarboxylase